jgi:DnaJ-class molecular chaperone
VETGMRKLDIKKKARNILGVPDKADMYMIRHAYRELAKRYHPDNNPNDNSLPKKFILITEAYEILCGVKNAGRHSIFEANEDSVNEQSIKDKPYWEWWIERFGDLL